MKTLIEQAEKYLVEDPDLDLGPAPYDANAKITSFQTTIKWDDLTPEKQAEISEEANGLGIAPDEIDFMGETGDYVLGKIKIYSI